MSEQTIQSQDISVAGIFQSFYAVPDYQREYVWEADQVEQLLSDISAEMDRTNPGDSPEYFIGSIVVCAGNENVWDLIDGQQRMTTLYVVLCAIRDRLVQMGEKAPGSLDPQIAAISTDANGQDKHRYRLELQYEDSGNVLIDIASGMSVSNSGKTTNSIENILNAYQTTLGFFNREFAEDSSALRVFYGYLTNKVKLIRIETENVAKALKIFETINDRGKGLNSMDLLKNLLFMKAKPDDFYKLKGTWKTLQDTIHDMGEKPLRFLRYFILASYDVEILREEDIYSWFVKNEKKCGYSDRPLQFAATLVKAAEAYRNFLNGKDHLGKESRYLQNMRLLGGKSARQHLIILLAGRHLPSELFDQLCKEVENLFFCYVITREATRDFERNFARWAVELRAIANADVLAKFVSDHFTRTKQDLSVRFDESMLRLHTDIIQQYRLRYVLGKLTQYVDMEGFGETGGTISLQRYADGGIDIEHIFPQNPDSAAAAEFGPGDYLALVGRLGNLVLAEPAINRALGNLPYSTKQPVYAESQFLLTRALAEKIKVGVNTSMDRAVSDLEPYTHWNRETIESRQAKLVMLARKAWDMPNH